MNSFAIVSSTPDQARDVEKEALLTSIVASMELAIFQIASGRTGSAIEILGEAMREAKGDPLAVH